MSRYRRAFGGLLLAQTAHSVEEYTGRLWETFPPARIVSGLFSDDPVRGFVVANLVLVGFGLWCWAVPMRREWRSAVLLAWVWVALEVGNGLGHPIWSVWQGGYTAGVATAPLLLVLASNLARELMRMESNA
jgi:hypothetical protein